MLEDPVFLILNFPAGDSVCLQWNDESKDLQLVPNIKAKEQEHDEMVTQFDVHH
jgi:hypothetical protein